MAKQKINTGTPFLKLREKLRKYNEEDGLSYRRIVAKYYPGLPHMTVYNIVVNGDEPTENTYRRMLGLPEIILQLAYRGEKGRFVNHPKEEE